LEDGAGDGAVGLRLESGDGVVGRGPVLVHYAFNFGRVAEVPVARLRLVPEAVVVQADLAVGVCVQVVVVAEQRTVFAGAACLEVLRVHPEPVAAPCPEVRGASRGCIRGGHAGVFLGGRIVVGCPQGAGGLARGWVSVLGFDLDLDDLSIRGSFGG
jgi:hypothetical protein